LKGRWKLVKKIGQGAFGEIYAGVDLEKQLQVAIKLEKWDNKKAVLKLEVAVLKKLQGCQYACQYLHCGHFEDSNYLVMELLGENLSDLRRKREGGKFTHATSARLGIQMLRAIQAIHELGYLHRDIKPSNFAMGLPPTRHRDCVMIDFGLTRKYRLANGEIRPPRELAGFRGTARYASINSHLCKELSRRDDLWSLLYVLIEFITGQLPWRKLKDKEEIGLQKMRLSSPDLVADMPPVFLPFMEHLQALDYQETPEYDMLAGLLQQLDPTPPDPDGPHFDWETSSQSTTTVKKAANTLVSNAADKSASEVEDIEDDQDRRGAQFSSDRAIGPTTAGADGHSSMMTPGVKTKSHPSESRLNPREPATTPARQSVDTLSANGAPVYGEDTSGIQMVEQPPAASDLNRPASQRSATTGEPPPLTNNLHTAPPTTMAARRRGTKHETGDGTESATSANGERNRKSCFGKCSIS